MKHDGRGLDHETLENLRRLAVRRVVEDGEEPSAVIASLGLCRTSIYPWLRTFHHAGWGALSQRIAPGPKPKLTEEQRQQVKHWIAGKDPRHHGLRRDLWTRKLIAKLIKKKLGVQLGVTAVGLLLAHLGITLQKPLLRVYPPDSESIRQWVEKSFPRLLARARRRHACIVFIDESGFMLAPLVRRTWAPRGCRPVIKIAEPHERISVIGAISISQGRKRFGFSFRLLEDNANFQGASLVQFLEDLRRKIREAITLLWDEIPIHRSKPVIDYLRRHRTIVAEGLPPYAPELNPVDYVWSYVKWGRSPNYAPPDLIELRRRITAEFRRLQKRPDLLNSFLQRTGLSADAALGSKIPA